MPDSPLIRAACAAAVGPLIAWMVLRTVLRHEGVFAPTRSVIWPALRGGRLNLVPLLAVTTVTVLIAQSGSALNLWGMLLTGATTTAAALVNGLFFLPSLRSMCTPYTGLSLSHQKAVPLNSPLFDVFLSYKAEDERYVRPIADWMLACGVRPWFDEYVILLSERDQFGKAIDFGLRNSRCAVIFLNEHYACGDGTLIELRGLIEHLPAERTLLIPLNPPEQSLAPEVRQIIATFPQPSPPLSPSDERATARWLAERIPGLDAARISDPEPMQPSLLLRAHGRDWRLHLHDWQPVPRPEPLPGEKGLVGDEIALNLTRKIQGIEVFWSVICGTMTIDQTLRRELLEMDRPAAKKRDMQQVVADLAREFVEGLGSPCVGVHLLYLAEWANVPQFAMTYWSDAWVRLYSVVLHATEEPTPGEARSLPAIQFDFQFFVQGTFADYCRTAPHLDRIVRSLSCR